uniref:Decapping nuclease n=1 Tax=Steinernema glaseri TaxID=37863 RepID=A0A1I7YIG3_9BILA
MRITSNSHCFRNFETITDNLRPSNVPSNHTFLINDFLKWLHENKAVCLLQYVCLINRPAKSGTEAQLAWKPHKTIVQPFYDGPFIFADQQATVLQTRYR